jgi:hypothetical protein
MAKGKCASTLGELRGMILMFGVILAERRKPPGKRTDGCQYPIND